MFNKNKEGKTSTLKNAKTTVNVVGKISDTKNKITAFISKNPEKAIMIFLGAVTVILVGSELKRNKTEVNVTINMKDSH